MGLVQLLQVNTKQLVAIPTWGGGDSISSLWTYSNTEESSVFARGCTTQDSQSSHHSIFIQYFKQFTHCLFILLLCVSLPSHAKAKPSYAYDKIILKTAVKEGVDPAFVHAVIRAESNYNHLAVSHAKAEGLMQLIPATAKRFNVKDSFDPAQNIRGGTKYLRWLLKRFNGDIRLALAGYNAGEGAVDKYNGIPPYRETQKYVKKVMRFYRQFKGLPPLHNHKLRRNKKITRQLTVNKKSSIKSAKQVQKAINILALHQSDKQKTKAVLAPEFSRTHENVSTSGSVHRVTSLTLINKERPLIGYSRITAFRTLQ